MAAKNGAIKLVAGYTEQAHAAQKYEDASLSLSRAADMAGRAAL